jgi:predicted TIM-barrel fold metal-dependent hydrolase
MPGRDIGEARVLRRLLEIINRLLGRGRDDGALWFDAHCHVFNVEYLALEASSMLFDIIRGAYPLKKKDAPTPLRLGLLGEVGAPGGLAATKDSLERFLAWAAEMLNAGFESEADNAAFVRSTGKAVFGRPDFALAPLMMDVYYMYAPALYRVEAGRAGGPAQAPDADGNACRAEAARAVASPGRPAAGPGPLSEPEGRNRRALDWEPAMADFRREVREAFERRAERAREIGAALEGTGRMVGRRLGVDAFLESLDDRLAEALDLGDEARYGELRLTPGFKRQLKAAEALGKANPGRVFPFFALDPRRPGAVEAVVRGGLVGAGGPFYGVKLYPRLGYHPGCAELGPVYRYCEESGIPVTAHASYKGFPDWMTDHADFGNPANWEPVVAAHPRLRLDLAHFGARTEDDSWSRTIAELMRRYKNVYSDLSCYTRREELELIAETYLKDRRISPRVMFGSDFDVMYFINPGEITLPSYYRMFLEVLGPEALGVMCRDAPRAFLFGDR